jgi:hypothetical protein
MAPGVCGCLGRSAWLLVETAKRSETGLAINHLTEEKTAKGKELRPLTAILEIDVQVI